MQTETHKRADPKLVAKCKADYLTARGTMDECAERHGLTPVNIRNRAAREGWKEQRDAQFLAMISPMTVDFESRLQSYRTRGLGMLEKMEEKIDEMLARAASEKFGPKELSQLASTIEIHLSTKAQVMGIPRIGSAKPPVNDGKQPPIEVNPLNEPLEPGTPEYENAITPLAAATT